jgi:hypothetical protein
MSRLVLGNEARRATIQDDNDYFTEQYIFKNREDAAKRLAAKLKLSIDKSANEFIILAIPRGGVVTGDVIASSLGSNLDIVVSRKIGAPYNPELAVGAIMHDGSFILNEDIVKILNVSQEYINEQTGYPLIYNRDAIGVLSVLSVCPCRSHRDHLGRGCGRQWLRKLHVRPSQASS